MQEASDSERRVVNSWPGKEGEQDKKKKRQVQVWNRLKSHFTHLGIQKLVLSWPIKSNFISSASLRVI